MAPFIFTAKKLPGDDLPGSVLGTTLTLEEIASSAYSGMHSAITVTASSSIRVGPVGSSATLSHNDTNILEGAINVTSSPRTGFGLTGSAYAGIKGGFQSSTPDAGTFSVIGGVGIIAKIDIGVSRTGMPSSINFTLGAGAGVGASYLTPGAQIPVVNAKVPYVGDPTNYVMPALRTGG
jgi:hypothetical protein